MFFWGTTFAQSSHTLDGVVPDSLLNIKNILIKNGIYDHLYGTENINLDNFDSEIVPGWSYETFLDANFKNSVFAGNVDFSVETTDELRIKRRIKGTYDWITLAKIKVFEEEDFSFIYYDNLASAKQTYEYAIVPAKGNTEGMMSIGEVYSDFDGLYIVGNDKTYFGFINLSYPAPTRRKDSMAITTLDSKYPYIINNSMTNYDSGTVSATFVEADENSEWGWDFSDGWRYRDEFKDWLLNGRAKILKYYNGRTWMVGISGEITDQVNLVEENTVTTFSWYQIGDPLNQEDLDGHGLLKEVK